MLGRQGRPAVVRALLEGTEQPWNVRGLASAAGVTPMTASRAIGELLALGVVDKALGRRDAHIQVQQHHPAVAWLRDLSPPDLSGTIVTTFLDAYQQPAGVTRIAQQESTADAVPFQPPRITIHCVGDDEAAWDALGPALDAVRQRALPAPEVDVIMDDRDS